MHQPRSEIRVTFEGDHIQVVANGEKSLETSIQIWEDVSRISAKTDCFDVLGVANTTRPVSAVEGYDHAELFGKLKIDQRYRIAWVELNPEAIEAIQFVETVLTNRALPGKLFETVDEAKAWLLAKGSAEA